MRKTALLILFACTFLLQLSIVPETSNAAQNKKIYYVPLQDEVEKGLYHFLNNSIKTAEEDGAEAIIFEINTPGGSVDAAQKIAQLFSSTDLRTIAFINNKALSAGAYLALNANEIYMVAGSEMGAAAVITSNGNAADKKAQSAWLSSMATAAEKNNRDPLYAKAMADEDIDVSKYDAPRGKLLTLTNKQALEVGYSEGTVKTKAELLSKLGYDNYQVETLQETFADKASRFLTKSYVVSILLTLGIIGVIIELFTPGFGLAGLLGMTSFFLFFYGHFAAGISGYGALILFAFGILLILLEFVLPGAIAGILGVIAVIVSFFYATGDVRQTAMSLLIALVVGIVVTVLMVRVFGKRLKLFNRIVLMESTSTENGYISHKNRSDLLGKSGVTISVLRPSGIALINGERLDVVSQGDFIANGKNVTVVNIEGGRVVVIEEPQSPQV